MCFSCILDTLSALLLFSFLLAYCRTLCVCLQVSHKHLLFFSLLVFQATSSQPTSRLSVCQREATKTPNLITNKQRQQRFSKQENECVGEPAMLWHSDSAPLQVPGVQLAGERAPSTGQCCSEVTAWVTSAGTICTGEQGTNTAQPPLQLSPKAVWGKDLEKKHSVPDTK